MHIEMAGLLLLHNPIHHLSARAGEDWLAGNQDADVCRAAQQRLYDPAHPVGHRALGRLFLITR